MWHETKLVLSESGSEENIFSLSNLEFFTPTQKITEISKTEETNQIKVMVSRMKLTNEKTNCPLKLKYIVSLDLPYELT